MSNPLVSVIVPTYNRKQLLEETLTSIINQTYKEFEIIVIDNKSNYDFFGFINSLNDKRIKPFQNENYGIIAKNRNFGINVAQGEYIAFCDDDDLWIPEKLEIQLEEILRTNSDFISSPTLYFENDKNHITGKSKDRAIKDLKDFITLNQISTSTVLLKNSGEIKFPEDPALVAIEDYWLWLNLYIKGMKFTFVDKPLVLYRLNLNNFTKKYKEFLYLKVLYLHVNVLILNPQLKKVYVKLIWLIFLRLFKFSIITFKNFLFKR